MAKVTKITQSPMNAQRWSLDLDCGHEKWVTAKRRPTTKTVKCEICADREHPSF